MSGIRRNCIPSFYAQYKDVKTVKAEIVKAAPKGNAAVELHEMIGLDNAKEVIENAVSFFKMQKLYAEKGIKADRPSMHMVLREIRAPQRQPLPVCLHR